MTEERKQALCVVLVGDMKNLRESHRKTYDELEAMVMADIEKIAPLIDRWIADALREGKKARRAA